MTRFSRRSSHGFEPHPGVMGRAPRSLLRGMTVETLGCRFIPAVIKDRRSLQGLNLDVLGLSEAAVGATTPTQMAYPKAVSVCRGRRMVKGERQMGQRAVQGARLIELSTFVSST